MRKCNSNHERSSGERGNEEMVGGEGQRAKSNVELDDYRLHVPLSPIWTCGLPDLGLFSLLVLVFFLFFFSFIFLLLLFAVPPWKAWFVGTQRWGDEITRHRYSALIGKNHTRQAREGNKTTQAEAEKERKHTGDKGRARKRWAKVQRAYHGNEDNFMPVWSELTEQRRRAQRREKPNIQKYVKEASKGRGSIHAKANHLRKGPEITKTGRAKQKPKNKVEDGNASSSRKSAIHRGEEKARPAGKGKTATPCTLYRLKKGTWGPEEKIEVGEAMKSHESTIFSAAPLLTRNEPEREEEVEEDTEDGDEDDEETEGTQGWSGLWVSKTQTRLRTKSKGTEPKRIYSFRLVEQTGHLQSAFASTPPPLRPATSGSAAGPAAWAGAGRGEVTLSGTTFLFTAFLSRKEVFRSRKELCFEKSD